MMKFYQRITQFIAANMAALVGLITMLLVTNHCCASTAFAINAQIEKIADQLEACPSWASVPIGADAERKRITDIYIELSRNDSKTLREGIGYFLTRFPLGKPGFSVAREKVFGLLRVAFNVPSGFIKADVEFGSLGNPMSDSEVNLLWPYSQSADGQLLLTGVSAKFLSGPPYDALIDFDHLQSNFGRRAFESDAIRSGL